MPRSSRHWFKAFARAGYSARGLIYTVVGVFAILAAFEAGENKDTQGAIRELLNSPFGTFLVAALLVGLFGYVAWRLVQALFDTDEHGWSPKGLAVRVGLLASAATYFTLALYGSSLLGIIPGGSGGGESGSGSEPKLAAYIADLVGKDWFTLALMFIFIGVAIAHWWKAFTGRYADHFEASDKVMSAIVHPVSVAGLAARGVVFALIAAILYYRYSATGESTSTSPPGIDDAFGFLQDLPAGKWLLLGLGCGVVVFAAYSFAEAIWRRINVEEA